MLASAATAYARKQLKASIAWMYIYIQNIWIDALTHEVYNNRACGVFKTFASHGALLCRATVVSMSVAHLDSLAAVTELTEAGDVAQSRRMNKNVDSNYRNFSKIQTQTQSGNYMIRWCRRVNWKRIIFHVKRRINRDDNIHFCI